MKLIRAKTNPNIYPEFDRLYAEAFPAEEQLPLRYLKRKARKASSDCIGVYDGGRFVGLLNLIYHADVVLVFYFAVSGDVRGHGFGSAILDALKSESAGKRIVLYIEPPEESSPNLDQRIRRKAFYEKNGFTGCGYRVTERGVTYDVLSCGGCVTDAELKALLRNYAGRLCYPFLFRFPNR